MREAGAGIADIASKLGTNEQTARSWITDPRRRKREQKAMATYTDIQAYVVRHYGFVPKTCWIAHVKELCGLRPPRAPNRDGQMRKVPCPPEKCPAIEEALRHFRLVA